MLIVNDEQRLRAGIGSMSKRCQYCSKALAAYPLILSDDARLAVYHAACAAELVVAVRKRKGQIQAMIFGWGRWYPVESVSIERLVVVAPVAS